ncbi:MAG TPA: acyclic terpene utilization AtuA family protein [Candidatus Kapabacteria bacterium]|nr:acyclic terpene utilization AtuA family protein [Candidatus Kapabacteria bacterium]
MKQMIRIAAGQGFWGDLLTAPIDQVTRGPIDYLVMDYLAEVTMSIMQKQKLKDPKLGYAKDLVATIDAIMPQLAEKGIRLITNGGGVNPEACRDAIVEVARRHGVSMKIGIVTGDNILDDLDALSAQGAELRNMENGEPGSSIRDRILSANVYLGAAPIVEALRQGAQIIVTGRTTDTGLCLAPMIHEFGWSMEDWDRLAAGTIAGHIIECGAQSSGGNYMEDWRNVPDMANIGFPIIEATPGGEFVVTKHAGTGGRVSRGTVAEQCLYEIGNPNEYITPDVIADFTTIHLEDEGNDRVRVHGITGRPNTPFYKVSMSYADGYSAFATLTYAWPDAIEKAKAADAILRARLEKLGLHFEEVLTEFVGYNACHGPLSEAANPDPQEVMMRIGVRGPDFKAVERFGKEIAPLILTGPPNVTGFAGGRPRPSEVVAYWPALIEKTRIDSRVRVEVTEV